MLDLTDVYWIHGNHDVDKHESYDNLFKSELANRNLDGKIVEIDRVKVAGLGGGFREKIWYPMASMIDPIYQNYEEAIDVMQRTEQYKKMYNPGISDDVLLGKALLHKSSIFYDTYEAFY
ncbi:MAG: hypothetical protein ABI475_02980 [Methylophilaceae bacterium]